jgi:hypothetical protein
MPSATIMLIAASTAAAMAASNVHLAYQVAARLALLRLDLFFTKPQDGKLTFPRGNETLAASDGKAHGLSADAFKLRAPFGYFFVSWRRSVHWLRHFARFS